LPAAMMTRGGWTKRHRLGSARLAKKGGENEEASSLSEPARAANSPWPHACRVRGTGSRWRVAKGPRPVGGLAPGRGARSRESCGGSIVRERVHSDRLQASLRRISPRVPRGRADGRVRVCQSAAAQRPPPSFNFICPYSKMLNSKFVNTT
jgi:hypothetical protein